MLKKRKRKRNPELQGIAKQILSEVDDWEYLAGGTDGEIYYFVIYLNLIINNITLQSGEYILKIFRKKINIDNIKYLKNLSNIEFIPKIYYIDNKIEIMEYIQSNPISRFKNHPLSFKKNLYNRLEKLIEKWHSNNYVHGDLDPNNILIDKYRNIHLIDPDLNLKSKKFDISKLGSIWFELFENYD